MIALVKTPNSGEIELVCSLSPSKKKNLFGVTITMVG